MKERPRFSGKEILKNSKTEIVIPENYKELKNANLLQETEKAYRLSFVYENNGYACWLPKNYILVKNGKYYCDNWLILKNTNIKK